MRLDASTVKAIMSGKWKVALWAKFDSVFFDGYAVSAALFALLFIRSTAFDIAVLTLSTFIRA